MNLRIAKLDALVEASLLDRRALREAYRGVRHTSTSICEPLEPEDCCVQSMPDVSPTKWHLAHTSWFFETFVLARQPSYRSFHPQFAVLFNSYYNSVGEQHARPDRGVLSRPTLAEVMDYRRHVDEAMDELLASGGVADDQLEITEQGLHHEQQHQELMLTDIKHVFFSNPLRPSYVELPASRSVNVDKLGWISYDGQLEWIGHEGQAFAFDNERPQHRAFIEAFQIADRLTTCGEYQAFIEDGGYDRPEFWLSDGWRTVQEEGWKAPLYWERNEDGDGWRIMTLGGMRDMEPGEPVAHVSYFEADAFARWAGCWLPREGAWESVTRDLAIEGNFLEDQYFHPLPVESSPGPVTPRQVFGDVWEWTCSPYIHYPGYRPDEGALGEYNGKFMCNQMVLRGGSCVTPGSHMRPTYRNFFPPDARWAFTGIRLASELV